MRGKCQNSLEGKRKDALLHLQKEFLYHVKLLSHPVRQQRLDLRFLQVGPVRQARDRVPAKVEAAGPLALQAHDLLHGTQFARFSPDRMVILLLSVDQDDGDAAAAAEGSDVISGLLRLEGCNSISFSPSEITLM